MSQVKTATNTSPYLENEKCTEVPSGHLPLAFGSFDFFFPKGDYSIERIQQSVLELRAEVDPSSGVVFSRGPRELYTSAKIHPGSRS